MNPDPLILAQATERLNEALREAEDALCALGLGVSASVALDDLGRTLQFRKIDNLFRLLVEVKPGDLQHITNVSRESRVRAATKLASLRKALLQNYETEVERVTNATSSVISLVQAIRAETNDRH